MSSSDTSTDEIFLGDPWQHREAQLQTHGPDESLLNNLQDGFEIPHWQMFLDESARFQTNDTTMSGDVISLVQDSMTTRLRIMRHHLQAVACDAREMDVNGAFLAAVEKRIATLNIFISNAEEKKPWEFQPSDVPKASKDSSNLEPGATSSGAIDVERVKKSPKSRGLLLVLFDLLVIIFQATPYSLALMRSKEHGTIEDKDFWYHVSINVFMIMASLAMIDHLRKSTFMKTHTDTWVSLALSILFAIASVGIYPICHTAWSSLLSLFSNIALSRATRGVEITIENMDFGDSILKQKTL